MIHFQIMGGRVSGTFLATDVVQRMSDMGRPGPEPLLYILLLSFLDPHAKPDKNSYQFQCTTFSRETGHWCV